MPCQALPMRLPSKTCVSSDTPCKFAFLQGLPPHPAWALMLMWLPSLYSTGSDTLRHTWAPFSPSMGADSPTGWPWPTIHAQPYLIVFGLKFLRLKGEWKEREKPFALILNMKEKFTLITLQASKKRLPSLTFQTFELIPTSCLIIKSLINTKMPLSTLGYNSLKWYMCVL